MSNTENNQKSNNNNFDDKGIELLVDKKLADAKVMIAEKRLNFLLAIGAAFLTIFGIIIPMFLSQQSENKVDRAIEKMEIKFNELAGKQLRKPKIECYIDGKNLVNSTIRLSHNNRIVQSIIIKNVGDGAAEDVTMRLYLNSDHEHFTSILSFYKFYDCRNDKPEFETSMRYNRDAFVLPAKDSFSIGFSMLNSQLLKEDAKATAILKIFYGEPSPIEVPFTIEVIKESDNNSVQ